MRISSIRLGAAAIAVIIAAGCSRDQSGNTSPVSPIDASPSMLKVGVKAAAVPKHEPGLEWSVSKVAGLSATGSIGPAGGSLSIPKAGVTVDVPPGAVSVLTKITVTVHPGKVVAYDFAPHGISFLKPLTITQQLTYTRAKPSTAALLNLGYYQDPSSVDDTGAVVSESNAGAVNLAAWTFVSSIWHFSGYMVATGRSGAMSDM